MSSVDLQIDLSGLTRGAVLGGFVRTLDRFAGRAAHEFAREEKLQAPKAFSTLTQSIAVQKIGEAYYQVMPTAAYAADVHAGSKPHQAPLLPLVLWLKHTKRVSDPAELRARARGLQRFIAVNGTKANPFVTRTREIMHDRVVDLIAQGARRAAAEVSAA